MPAPQGHNQRQFLSVVSPCSSCKNNRTSFTPEGLWPCPRKVWEERYRTVEDKHLIPGYLLEKGGADDKYANPVHTEKKNSVVVWTADLVNNGSTYRGNKEINPHILDPNFSSEFIRCNEYPSLIGEPEQVYFQSGCLQEKHQVMRSELRLFQISGSDEKIGIDSVVNRASAAFQYSFKTHEEDILISGM